MAGEGILDTDMATLARWARTGFDWWLDELRALLPARVLAWATPGPAIVAHFDGATTGDALQLTRRGMPVAQGSGRHAVALVLPATSALTRDVALPILGIADMRRLVALDAERLLPFAPGTALIDFDAGPASGGVQAVSIAGLPVDRATMAMALAEAQDLDVRRLAIGDGEALRFDFLPAWRQRQGHDNRRPQRIWWSIVAAAFLLNLGVLIGRDIYNLRATEALVETHGQTAATARLLRNRVIAEDGRRRALLGDRHRHDPLPILAAVARALPDSVWVQRLSWDGRQLRLAGYKPGNIDVVAALRHAPIFVAVRGGAADVPANIVAGQPYDVTAETTVAATAGADAGMGDKRP